MYSFIAPLILSGHSRYVHNETNIEQLNMGKKKKKKNKAAQFNRLDKPFDTVLKMKDVKSSNFFWFSCHNLPGFS